jgi:hypothetical protein
VLAAAGRVAWPWQADATVTGAAAARELAYDTTLRFTHRRLGGKGNSGCDWPGQEKLAAAEDIFYLTTEEGAGHAGRRPAAHQTPGPPSGSGCRLWCCPW